ncbi:hypothetical protein [Nonomuraea harbinensis]|uniref:Uncharacterized protein n=1 Tax=Nonomuraea harbinensis TaxID=1286938 RepID=A0ABW1C134_9ACTN|nr:hypothetical protein [Nonomuraea harbinensis]
MKPVKNGKTLHTSAFACSAATAVKAAALSDIELRSGMADVIFVVLTIAVSAVPGLVVRAVERL